MIVTDLKYYLDPALVKKLDLMTDRCTRSSVKKDSLLITEGAEGEGKTNTSVALAYYVKYTSGMPIYLFFRLEALIRFAQSNTNKVIIWDEPSLDALSTDSLNRINKDLIRLLMAVRMNRHFFLFNFTKFHKFNEYIVVDRALGLIHMYSRKEIEPGRYIYVKKRNLEKLYLAYKQSKKRLYKKYATGRGTIPEVMNKYFNQMDINVNGIEHATLQDYEAEKSKAIEGIGKQESKKDNKAIRELKLLKKTLSLMKVPIETKEILANKLGITSRTLERWKNMIDNEQKTEDSLEKNDFEADDDNNI